MVNLQVLFRRSPVEFRLALLTSKESALVDQYSFVFWVTSLMKGLDMAMLLLFCDADMAVIKRTSEVVVLFAEMFIQLIFPSKAKGAPFTRVDRTEQITYHRVGNFLVASQVMLRSKGSLKRTTINIAPVLFDVNLQVLFEIT